MTVYVDPPFVYPIDATHDAQAKRVAQRNGGRWSHLWAESEAPDAVEELHALAQRIGLRRSWFQAREGFPHYDVTPSRRAAAIRAGAVETSLREWIRARLTVRRRRPPEPPARPLA